jgi:hypothetical protein
MQWLKLHNNMYYVYKYDYKLLIIILKNSLTMVLTNWETNHFILPLRA